LGERREAGARPLGAVLAATFFADPRPALAFLFGPLLVFLRFCAAAAPLVVALPFVILRAVAALVFAFLVDFFGGLDVAAFFRARFFRIALAFAANDAPVSPIAVPAVAAAPVATSRLAFAVSLIAAPAVAAAPAATSRLALPVSSALSMGAKFSDPTASTLHESVLLML
jgi:hypothetical protein